MNRRTSAPSMAATFEGIKADYTAAKASRFRRRRTGLPLSGGGADYHYRSEGDYLRVMEYARDMFRNDVVVKQMIARAVDNIVQDGIQLDVQTGDDAVDEALQARWDAWRNNPQACDAMGQLTFADMERLVKQQEFVDGDMFALPLEDGTLQLIEAHRCRTPSATKRNVVHGVLLDDMRRRLEYWFTRDEIDPMMTVRLVSEMQRIAAHDGEGNPQVFHIFTPDRVTQTRGISAIAPAFDVAGMFEDINFAKMVQQQVVSCFAVFRELPIASGDTPYVADAYGEQRTETLGDGRTRLIDNISPGMEIVGRPGEKLQGFSPSVPNQEFFQHVRLILQLISVNLGLPLVLALLDASETNFSGWRGAIDQARIGFKRNQRALASRFHTPVYQWKVRQWMAEDAALRSAAKRQGVNVFGHVWNPPTWQYIEPLKDAEAAATRLEKRLVSKRKLHAEEGRDFWKTTDELVADHAYEIRVAKKAAAEINKEFPDDPEKVSWKDLLGMVPPKGAVATPAKEEGKAGAKKPKGDE